MNGRLIVVLLTMIFIVSVGQLAYLSLLAHAVMTHR